MRIKSKLLTLFSIVIIIFLALFSLSLIQLRQVDVAIDTEIPTSLKEHKSAKKIAEFADSIRYYDEVLTQSARNYAFTQDKYWEERYLAAEPKLDYVIKETIKIGNEQTKKAFEAVDATNVALVDM